MYGPYTLPVSTAQISSLLAKTAPNPSFLIFDLEYKYLHFTRPPFLSLCYAIFEVRRRIPRVSPPNP